MELIALYPSKGLFRPGDDLTVKARIQAEQGERARLRVYVYALEKEIERLEIDLVLAEGQSEHFVTIPVDGEAYSSFGLRCLLYEHNSDEVLSEAFTALEILDSWTQRPRYGFLSDFNPQKADIEAVIESMLRHHVNGIQFYDWQYRHDNLLPPEVEYQDPLGRSLSLTTIRTLIDLAHAHAIVSMPYMAVYAASNPFARLRPEWALYDEHGDPVTFEDFLSIMDPSEASPWSRHIIDQCKQVLENLPFDGIHIDQYGEPRTGFNAKGEAIDLPQAFVDFLSDLKMRFPSKVLTFNAVKNWPIEYLAPAPQDFVYIELWPDMPEYAQVRGVVRQARTLSDNKGVVIALYLPAKQMANIKVLDAVIYACGATRIEVGEESRLLSDPYFPNHEAISAELEKNLRAYTEFSVRYTSLLGPHAIDVDMDDIHLPKDVICIARRIENKIGLNFINLSGSEKAQWTEQHGEARPIKPLSVRLNVEEEIRAIFNASPDDSDPGMRPIEWTQTRGKVEMSISSLKTWNLTLIELKSDSK